MPTHKEKQTGIDPRELRIGNWILIDGEPRQINWLYPASITYDRNGVNTVYSVLSEDPAATVYPSLEPIPITPEWLERLGGTYSYFVAEIHGIELVFEQMIFRYYYAKDKWKDVNYIHELQNLIKALTGHELTITGKDGGGKSE